MDIPALIQLMQNKVTILSNAKALAFSSGDLDRMNAIDNDLLGTQNTLSQLNMLLEATRAANTSSLDVSSVLTAGVQAAQAASAIPEAPTAVLSDYDISTYAADPAYIQKITDMLANMPTFDNTVQIDMYIDKEVVGSPLTGAMVMDATTKYAVDARLAMAIMELDSRFGTAGVGAQTFNPGNVGNTGTSTQTYGSWSDGVAAVAYWLSRHRAGGPVPVAPAVVAPVVEAAVVPPAAIVPDTSVPDTTAAATSTPAILPPVPVTIVSTSTDPVITTVVASTTDAMGTTTVTTTTTTATTTTATDASAATSTPGFDFNITGNGAATSTPEAFVPAVDAASGAATSTPAMSATSTDPIILAPAADPAQSTSTLDAVASTTQARRSSKRKSV